MILPEQWFAFLRQIQSEEKPLQAWKLLYDCLGQYSIALLSDQKVSFPDLYSRLMFIARTRSISSDLLSSIHGVRVSYRRMKEDPLLGIPTAPYIASVAHFIALTSEVPFPEEFRSDITVDTYVPRIKPHFALMRLICVEKEEGQLTLSLPEHPENKWKLRAVDHDFFSESIGSGKVGDLINLINAREEEDRIVAERIVFHPDYLVDVSSLAECFQKISRQHIQTPDLYFINRYQQFRSTEPLFLGNLVNGLLDKLVHEYPDFRPFKTHFAESFTAFPLEYLRLFADNSALVAFMRDRLQPQFRNLIRVIGDDFKSLQPAVSSENVLLEPSFVAPQIGLQGRLDLLHESNDGKHTIVELKSGKTPWPPDDPTMLGDNHRAQSRMYRMLLNQVKSISLKDILVYVLYSSALDPGTNLRFVAPSSQGEKEILEARNGIVQKEYVLAHGSPEEAWSALTDISFTSCGLGPEINVPAFFSERFELFSRKLTALNEVEKDYFVAYTQFVSREQWISRLGDGIRNFGHANLWLQDDQEVRSTKQLGPLRIVRHSLMEKDPRMELEIIHQNADETDFRKGDICVLYPWDNGEGRVNQQQVIKCFIVEDPDSAHVLKLGFRFPQRNTKLFDAHPLWAIEHDHMDHSFRTMHRELFGFVTEASRTKELLLNGASPLFHEPQIEISIPKEEVPIDESRNQLERLLKNAIGADDYFLLVGPPGTGKTKLFLRHFCRILQGEDENLLLLAYTNKAVDEICEAVISALGKAEDALLRIGSGISCGAKYQRFLLHRLASKSNDRNELKEAIAQKRIVVSTVSSILNRPDIFDLMHFDRIVVDEASQVLEPFLANLLRSAKKFILIGDEKQLPAVVQQRLETETIPESLQQKGFESLSNSLFERLLIQSNKNNWHHCKGTLGFQGRMHPNLMAFVNQRWYNGILKSAALPHQTTGEVLDTLPDQIQSRLLFVDSGESSTAQSKTHPEEAEITASIVQLWANVYRDPVELAKRIGIITPYRSQIARIKGALRKRRIQGWEFILVDTVERYQGSQRDHIIMSTAVQNMLEMDFLGAQQYQSPLDGLVVDRKLNVAYTRARKQFILIGQESVLRTNPEYAALLSFIASNGVVTDRFAFEPVSSPK